MLGLLADLRAPVPDQVVLHDPDALLERSVGDLLCDLGSPQALAQALDLIFEQVPKADFESFLVEVIEHGGDAAQPLLAGLVADPRTPRAIAERLIRFVRPTPVAEKPSQTRGRAAAEERLARRAPSRPRMQRALRLLAHGQLGLAHQELLALRAQ